MSSNKPFDSLWNTIGNAVLAVESATVIVDAKFTVVPAITLANVLPFTVIASASIVPSISTSPDISKLAAVTVPVNVGDSSKLLVITPVDEL